MSGLAQFRVEAPTAPPPPTSKPWADGAVFAVDQSLSATGWALLESHQGALRLHASASIMTDPKNYPGGHEGSLQRAVYVADKMSEAVAWAFRLVIPVEPTFVHETPPVATRMVRPESSLLAALGCRLALAPQGLYDMRWEMVQNQHSKTVLTGKRDATKKEWHAALGYYPIAGIELASNEGQRDAACLALTYLIDHAGDE